MIKRILFITPDGRCPIDHSKDDEIAVGVGEAFKTLNGFEFELLAICSGEYNFPIDSIVRRASHKNPLMSIVIIGENNISDRVALSLVDATIKGSAGSLEIERKLEQLIEAKRLLSECDLVGKSPEIRAVGELIYRVAPTDLPVLIVGESGTGKELVAKAIHKHSNRADKRFLPVNAAAIAPGTLESELFGHEKGSFTGASSQHRGFFEQADGGTLFLDEIAELPLPVQAKLLRVLETGDIMRIGGKETVHTDIRLVAATNKDLIGEALSREFRQDLYYRLSAVKIKIPPLRERPEDIPVLIYKFAQKTVLERNIEDRGFSEKAVLRMMDYHWPGNVRELRNLVENALLLSDGTPITPEDLDPYFEDHDLLGRSLPVFRGNMPEEMKKSDIERALMMIVNELNQINSRLDRLSEKLTPHIQEADLERRRIVEALEKNNGDKRKAAEELGISIRTLYRRLKKHHLLSG